MSMVRATFDSMKASVGDFTSALEGACVSLAMHEVVGEVVRACILLEELNHILMLKFVT